MRSLNRLAKMGLELHFENLSKMAVVPSGDLIRDWASAALEGRRPDAELCIRVVDEAEGRELNRRYRGRDKATNVLSFPVELPTGVEHPLLGDLVICAPVVAREAGEQEKEPNAHWAHLVIHGVLHLLGFDHLREPDASEMEAMEVRILDGLGIPDPYRERAATRRVVD